MKIAIIGGGFYGLHIAYKILQKNKKIFIDIFEKEKSIFAGAFTNNQHRLHLGYHYPRSERTIIQSIMNYSKFMDEYSRFIKIPKYNIYSIHEKSIVGIKEYSNIFKNFNLSFKEINNEELHTISSKKIKTKNIIGSLITKEGTVNFFGISNFLKEKINENVNIYLQKEIIHMPNNYDFVINATYNCPNLFLKEKIDLKHELCCILLGKNIIDKDIGLTIMDGEFCSIFPKENNIHSISSVRETPFFKYSDSSNIIFNKRDIFDLYIRSKAKEKIIEHANEYADITLKDITGEMLSIKTKFAQDTGDSREAIFKKEGNYYSIFCGKISAICSISEEIINDIGI